MNDMNTETNVSEEKAQVAAASEEVESTPSIDARDLEIEALRENLAVMKREMKRTLEALQVANDEQRLAEEARDAAIEAREMAIGEMKERTLDMEMRAKRVDIEKLRDKVEKMKKNLTTVDARSDERFIAKIRENEAECEARIAGVRAEEKQAGETLVQIREGEAARIATLEDAMKLILSWNRRDKGAPRTEKEVIANIDRILCAGLAKPR